MEDLKKKYDKLEEYCSYLQEKITIQDDFYACKHKECETYKELVNKLYHKISDYNAVPKILRMFKNV